MTRQELLTIGYDRILDGKETDKAWCFLIDDKVIYFPKSQVEDIRETARELDAPRWLVEAKGLEGYVK